MGRLMCWIEARLPVMAFWNRHFCQYYVPKNLNALYLFGSLALLLLVNQVLSGIWLAMSYQPSVEQAFASVQYLMREVEFGWLIRHLHSTGASALFVVMYVHLFRGFLYGSYQKPRELVWVLGMWLYVGLMAEAFLGYLLPWGQMSYWGAQVILALLEAIPGVGDTLAQWVRGDYVLSGVTLNRFYALHVVAIPLGLLLLVLLHLVALRRVGSNNPAGIEIKKTLDKAGRPLDGIPFHPYYTVKDLLGVAVFLLLFCGVVFFYPDMHGLFLERSNAELADPLKTPEHIAPLWYFTPFYAMLRAVPDKLLGIFTMGAAIALLFMLPWLDRSPVRSMRYKGWVSRAALLGLCGAFLGLGVLGLLTPSPEHLLLARVLTLVYFACLLLLPFYSRMERCLPVPARISSP